MYTYYPIRGAKIHFFPHMKQKKRASRMECSYKKLAATYFSTNKCSIIGDVRLNFSVRNGKR